jgi:hypothetical protein
MPAQHHKTEIVALKGRVVVVSVTLLICIAGIIALFWQQELQYQVPTPLPSGYVDVPVGQIISLPATFRIRHAYFLHFYNPDCPCSRFNVSHLRSLIGAFHDSISIVVVVPDADAHEKARSEFGSAVNIVEDKDGKIAFSCGVYSTPQAAIIDNDQKLYYRGNYNRSRYCTTRASNFAELSLIAMLQKSPPPSFGIAATQSYGCELKQSSSEMEFF